MVSIMKRKKTSRLSHGAYLLMRRFVRLCYGKTTIIGKENLPNKNTILVANHAQINGPLVGELFLPQNCYIWCAGQMMRCKDVPKYAYKDFWSQKPRWIRPIYRVLSYIIAPLAAWIFQNARTIAVWRDVRIMSTFKETIKHLSNGDNILIFPEKDAKYNNILYQLQDRFIDIAALYYKKAGECITFVPMYIAPTLKKGYIGNGILFQPDNDLASERSRISNYLSDEITSMARELPEHIVVPYRNINKKYYLTNKDITEVPNEKTRR
jgi:hypothetical protein